LSDEVGLCSDGDDNDCDSQLDCADSDCTSDLSCASCGDGTCDPGENSCSCAADCGAPPGSEIGLCTDAIDNDCDSLLDCGDPDCAADAACSSCGNGSCEPGESPCDSPTASTTIAMATSTATTWTVSQMRPAAAAAAARATLSWFPLLKARTMSKRMPMTV
jgi:hypothetical protein